LKQTLTIRETAAILGIGRGLCYELARRGDIPVIRLGRRVLVPEAALNAYLGGVPDRPAEHDDDNGGAE